jgi:putative transposase
MRQPPSYRGYRFPPAIIGHAVWRYYRFCLSFRDTEDLLAQRGIVVSYETIRQWCGTFGSAYARTLRRQQGRLGDTWYLDELFITMQRRQQYLWCAVDRDGDVIDILVQPRRDGDAAERFFRKLLKGQRRPPRRVITDTLRSYAAALRRVMPSVVHSTTRDENNAPSCRISQLANANARCAGSNPPPTCNASCPCTVSCGTCFAWGAICSGRRTIVC